MSKFGYDDQQREEGYNEDRVSKWLTPLSVETILLLKASVEEVGANKTSKLKVLWRAAEPTPGLSNEDSHNCQIAQNEYWLTEKAINNGFNGAKKAFFNLAKRLGVLDEWLEAVDNVATEAEYATAINNTFGGIEFAGLISAERQWIYEKDDDNNKTNVVSPWDRPTLATWASCARPLEDAQELVKTLEERGEKLMLRGEKPEGTVIKGQEEELETVSADEAPTPTGADF